MTTVTNPRSVLHALDPLGLGTGDCESLLSYFCRLAGSHSTSTLSLSRAIAQRFEHEVEQEFDWFHRQFSGLGEAALTWSSALSALTSIPRLDRLTFLPWRDMISQNGLPIVSKGQFCPQCLAEDQAAGHAPYFRLTWELKTVSVCPRHRVRLSQHCPCCGKDNVRHAAALVVPGWCTKCGAFLGGQTRAAEPEMAIEAVELWRARQVYELVRVQQSVEQAPSRDMLVATIEHIIGEMDGGQATRFAGRVGLSKGTVHYWLKSDKTPTLDASLAVASQSGIGLSRLLTGQSQGWTPPTQGQQLALTLFKPECRSKSPARTIDWEEVDRQLQKFLHQPNPVSVREVSRQLGIEVRQLYLRDNQTTRQIGQRWLAYLRRRKVANLQEAIPHLESAGKEVLMAGKSLNLREMKARLPHEVTQSIQGFYGVLKDVRLRLVGESPEHHKISV